MAKQRKKSLFTPRCDAHLKPRSSRSCSFERLESRAMLSLTAGPMPLQHHAEFFQSDVHHFSDSRQSDAVSSWQYAARTEEVQWHDWGFGMQGGFRGQPRMSDAMRGPYDQWGGMSELLAPPPPQDFGPPPMIVQVEQITIYRVTIPANTGAGGLRSADGATSLVGASDALTDHFGNEGGDKNHIPGPTPSDGGPPSFFIPPGPNLSGYHPEGFFHGPVIVTSPVLSPTVSREIESSGMWTSALDAALQSYTSQLLLGITAPTTQLVASNSALDQAPADTDSTDGFIHLNETIAISDLANSTDSIATEHSALDEILRGLKGVDSLPVQSDSAATATGDQDGQIADAVFGSANDLADADSGMVLLQAKGDATESPINLAAIAEAHPELLSAHFGVEAAVGVYQSVDRGFEEMSAAENVPVGKPSAQPSQQAKRDNHYSSNVGASTSSPKSAAALTVSAVAGGLLWVATRKNSDEEDAEERTVSQLVR